MLCRNAPCKCGSGLKYKHCCAQWNSRQTLEQQMETKVRLLERLSRAYGGELVAEVMAELEETGDT